MEKKIPMRTCIACRACKPKKELARIVKTENGIVYDATGKVNGRGAYICKDGECINKLRKGKLLNRAFSCQVTDAEYDVVEVQFFEQQK